MMIMTCGIYLITNKKTGQKYVGQSVNIEKRWRKHCSLSNNYENSYIDSSIRKYGKSMFKLDILEVLPKNQDVLNEREIFWIEKYGTFKNKSHYNLTSGGKSLIGENHPMYGKHLSEESKIKISNSLKGTPLSEKARQKLFERKGDNHPMYGKQFSDEIRIKMSQSRNNMGYYRVSKHNDSRIKQGFDYRYDYTDENGTHKTISRQTIPALEQAVKEKGLPWKKFED